LIAKNSMMILSNTKCLLDSNILIAVVNPKSENHKRAKDFLEESQGHNLQFVVSSQNFLETSTVLVHGLKIPRRDVSKSIRVVLEDPLFTPIYPNVEALKRFFTLIADNAVVHLTDLFLAATALAYGITTIATNDRDFEKIKGIKVYNPFAS